MIPPRLLLFGRINIPPDCCYRAFHTFGTLIAPLYSIVAKSPFVGDIKKLIVALLTLLVANDLATVETWEFEPIADVYTIYRDIDGVLQDVSYENFADEEDLHLNRWQDYGDPHFELCLESTLLDFDLSTLDDSVEYTSISLSMFLTEAWVLYSWMDLVELSVITESWDEYTVTGVDSPAYSRPPLGAYGSAWRDDDIGTYVTASIDPVYISYLLDDANHGIYLEHAPPEVDYWYFASRETSNPPKLIVEYDDEASIAPLVADQNPADEATDVPRTSNIVFHLTDEHSGVDVATINFTVEAEDSSRVSTNNETLAASGTAAGKGTITGSLSIDDTDIKDVVCTFAPYGNLPSGSKIHCTVAAGLADNAGIATDTDIVWSFVTVGDSTVEETTWGQIKAM